MSLDPKEFAQRLIEEAKKEAERIIAEAEKKAQEIIAQAKQEAERIRRQKEEEAKRMIRFRVAQLVGTEKRKARLEVSLKRRELVDAAVERGAEEARKRLSKEIMRNRLKDILEMFPDVKRTKLIGPAEVKELADELNLEFEERDLDGFILMTEDMSVEETIASRVDRRRKLLEAIAAERILGRRVRL